MKNAENTARDGEGLEDAVEDGDLDCVGVWVGVCDDEAEDVEVWEGVWVEVGV